MAGPGCQEADAWFSSVTHWTRTVWARMASRERYTRESAYYDLGLRAAAKLMRDP